MSPYQNVYWFHGYLSTKQTNIITIIQSRNPLDYRYDDNDNQSESSQEAELEFEESLDVTATLETSRRRSLDDDGEEDSVSSPQLMYGDTSLE